MDFKFNVSGLMDVDVTKYKVHDETHDGVFEWEHDGKLYHLVLGVEVFDFDTNEFSYIVGDDNLGAAGFVVHDYSDIQWKLEKPVSEISSKGININELD